MIVLSTTIADDEDILSIRDRLDELCGRGNWHCDCDDRDKVLSIRIAYNLGPVFVLLDAASFSLPHHEHLRYAVGSGVPVI